MKITLLRLCSITAAALTLAAMPFSALSAPATGDHAPLFSGRDQDGHKWKLADHLGKSIVFLYFYPKDNTAGCTDEACSLRDNLFELKQLGVDVVGVSFDNKDSHKIFAFKNNLSYPLLADTDGKIADEYGARMRDSMKIDRRVSFLIGLDGRIVHITDSPDPSVHVKEMTTTVANLTGRASPQ